ncbi:MAG: RNA polymerase sigma-70 factor [Mangrovibacterium sp.]
MIENKLWDQIITGDKKAFDQLFLLYYKSLCRFACTFVQSTNDSEDIVQTMFVRLWANRRKLHPLDNPKAFLFKSVYFEAMKLMRTKNVREKNLAAYFSQFKFRTEEENDHSAILPHLQKAIGKLPERCRQTFILNKLEGLTQEEIANYLGVSVKTVESQVAIALTKLREELKPFIHLLPVGFVLVIFQ